MGLLSMKRALKLLIIMCFINMGCQNPNEDCCNVLKEVKIGEAFSINEGETVEVQNSIIELTFSDVIGDSLCPEDVQCITQGTLSISIDINGTSRNLSIGDSQNPSTNYKDYTIELQRLVYPTKQSEKDKINSTYAIQMLISRL